MKYILGKDSWIIAMRAHRMKPMVFTQNSSSLFSVFFVVFHKWITNTEIKNDWALYRIHFLIKWKFWGIFVLKLVKILYKNTDFNCQSAFLLCIQFIMKTCMASVRLYTKKEKIHLSVATMKFVCGNFIVISTLARKARYTETNTI